MYVCTCSFECMCVYVPFSWWIPNGDNKPWQTINKVLIITDFRKQIKQLENDRQEETFKEENSYTSSFFKKVLQEGYGEKNQKTSSSTLK